MLMLMWRRGVGGEGGEAPVRSGVGWCEVLTDLWCVDVRLGREVRGD